MTSRATAAVALCSVGGLALGMAYFASLRRGVQISVGRHAWLPYMLFAPARIAAAAVFFACVLRWGIPVLLGAFAGFLVARQLAVRAVRRLA
jgi:hypothetical protein